jgi:hypothetical protein
VDKIEKTRLCNLSLRDAAQAVVECFDNLRSDGLEKYIADLRYVLDNNPVEKKVKS